MKTRIGFVSNSSSSSFIVGFEHRPADKFELFKMMFGDDICGNVSVYDDYSMLKNDIVERVWNDLQEQDEPMTNDEIIDEIASGYFDGYPDGAFSSRASEQIANDYRKKFGNAIHEDYKTRNKEKRALVDKYYELSRKEMDEYSKLIKDAAKEYFLKKKVLIKGRECFRFEYEDGSESGTVMEHGGIFDRIPHIKVSHH